MKRCWLKEKVTGDSGVGVGGGGREEGKEEVWVLGHEWIYLDIRS